MLPPRGYAPQENMPRRYRFDIARVERVRILLLGIKRGQQMLLSRHMQLIKAVTIAHCSPSSVYTSLLPSTSTTLSASWPSTMGACIGPSSAGVSFVRARLECA